MLAHRPLRDFWYTIQGEASPLDEHGRPLPPPLMLSHEQKLPTLLPDLARSARPLWNTRISEQGAKNAAHARSDPALARLAGLTLAEFRGTPVERLPLVVPKGSMRRGRESVATERRILSAQERAHREYTRRNRLEISASQARLRAKRIALEAASTARLRAGVAAGGGSNAFQVLPAEPTHFSPIHIDAPILLHRGALPAAPAASHRGALAYGGPARHDRLEASLAGELRALAADRSAGSGEGDGWRELDAAFGSGAGEARAAGQQELPAAHATKGDRSIRARPRPLALSVT